MKYQSYRMRLKKSLTLLIAIIGINFSVFSQKDIILTEGTARLVVKDLVTFDGLKSERQVLSNQIKAIEDKVLTLQEVIDNLNEQLKNRTLMIEQKDAQIQNYIDMTDDLKSALARERRMKGIYKIGSVIGLSAVVSKILF